MTIKLDFDVLKLCDVSKHPWSCKRVVQDNMCIFYLFHKVRCSMCTIVLTQLTSWPVFSWRKIKRPIYILHYKYMLSTLVFPQYHSWPVRLFTHIARKRDSLQMVCFNVISDGHALPFLSTYFANLSCFFSTCNKVLAYFHHWFHLFIKVQQVSWSGPEG